MIVIISLGSFYNEQRKKKTCILTGLYSIIYSVSEREINHKRIVKMRTGFDNEKYLKIQSEHIKERISQFGDKLYLEFGGKLFDDYHASRVLPGFAPDSKLQMLMQLSDVAEIVIVISAADIEKNKVRGDLGITYDVDVVRLIGEFEKKGLYVGSVVITQFAGQNGAVQFREKTRKTRNQSISAL